MKKSISILSGILLGVAGLISLNSCSKKITTYVYRDTTIIQYRDTATSKETYLYFLYSGANTISVTPIIAGELPLFNKASFVGVDSIVFYTSGYNSIENPGGSIGSSVIQLYDKTDGKLIGGSKITISDPTPNAFTDLPLYPSINLFDSIPGKTIDLQVLCNSSSTDNRAATVQGFFILYRK